jgi:hypothetical protein
MELIPFDEWERDRWLNRFDLYSEALDTNVEVKGSSKRDQLLLFDKQLDGQVAQLGFPVDSGFSWIFSYDNSEWRNGIRYRLLKENGKTPEETSKFLAEHTTVAFAVDTYLLHALHELNGTHKFTRDAFCTRHVVSVNRTKLREVANTARASLVDLGFSNEITRWLPHNAKRIRPRCVKTEMDGHAIEFELVLLLPSTLKRRLLKQMNGAVMKI